MTSFFLYRSLPSLLWGKCFIQKSKKINFCWRRFNIFDLILEEFYKRGYKGLVGSLVLREEWNMT
jgi:hypothetical protein